MQTIKQFLEFVGAPWTACHDHPEEETAKDLATIRPSNKLGYDSVCGVYGCDYDGEIGEVQRARRDLVAAAPDLLEALEACMMMLYPSSDEYQQALAAIAKATGEDK